MKKMILFLVAFGVVSSLKAENLITTTLLDHVAIVTQFHSGETRLALVDSVVQIGSVKGKSILDLQAGFSGETAPDAGEVTGANFIAGGFLKVSSLLGTKVNFPAHWRFLNSIEHGVKVDYDFREEDTSVSYQVGLAFTLAPK